MLLARRHPDAALASRAWRVRVLHADLVSGQLTVEMATPDRWLPRRPVWSGAGGGLRKRAAPWPPALHPMLHLVGPVRLADGRVQSPAGGAGARLPDKRHHHRRMRPARQHHSGMGIDKRFFAR